MERKEIGCIALFSSLLFSSSSWSSISSCSANDYVGDIPDAESQHTKNQTDRKRKAPKTSQAHQAKVRTVMAVGQVSVSRRVSTSVLMVLFLVVRNNSRNWWLENVYSFRQPILGNDDSLLGIRILMHWIRRHYQLRYRIGMRSSDNTITNSYLSRSGSPLPSVGWRFKKRQ